MRTAAGVEQKDLACVRAKHTVSTYLSHISGILLAAAGFTADDLGETLRDVFISKLISRHLELLVIFLFYSS